MNDSFTTEDEKVGRAVPSAPSEMMFGPCGGLGTARPTIFTVEGVTAQALSRSEVLPRVFTLSAKPEDRRAWRDTFDHPTTPIASPSPLNGERAGVRGVTGIGTPLSAAPRLFPFTTP